MKKLYFLLIITYVFSANAQIVNIPDANFKAKLLSASATNEVAKNNAGNWVKIDSNNDSEIQTTEANLISFLNVSNSLISDLSGIESFLNIKTLYCRDNTLSSINLSDLILLEKLNCGFNQLTQLNISNLSNLTYIGCNNNLLTNLDFSNLNNLLGINCSFNNLTQLNVSNCVLLKQLFCSNNQLIDLNIDTNTNLQNLFCQNNSLTTFNNSNNFYLFFINLNSNHLNSLNIKNNLDENNIQEYEITAPPIELNVSINFFGEFLTFDNNPNLQYICIDEFQFVDIQNKIIQYGYTNCHINSYCSFAPGGTFYTINGNNRFDNNNNGCDVTDVAYPNLNYSVTNGTNFGTLIANNLGNYTIPVQTGNHTLTPILQNPSYFTISPTSVTASFPSQASPFLQDFCITPNGTHSDVQISLIPIGVARPGFDATYKLVYKNVGNQLENGTITFKSYNPEVIDFVSSVPVFTTQNEITNLLTYSWNYTNLVPFETREIIINLNLNGPMEIPALNAGDLLSYDAQISTTNADENLLDNFAGIRQEVVNSYDPNDKTCLEGETIDPSMIGKYVHYQIRFENTGTYPAQNVVVKDMIDATKFDVSSLQMVNSSHSCYTRISGNKVEFIFENINLPFEDATNDGYIVFKIKTLPTLTINSTISNTAEIYFDYNFPIITNTATSTYQTLASSSFDFENEFTLYPNPAKNMLNISAKNNLEVSSVEIYNLVGQLVIVKPNFSASIDVSNLASGTYFIKVNTQKGSGNGKFVKE